MENSGSKTIIKAREKPIAFVDVWGFNHPDEEKVISKIKIPSFEEVPPGHGAGREWER